MHTLQGYRGLSSPSYDLPLPRLPGAHQAMNAALAVAMLRHQNAVPVLRELTIFNGDVPLDIAPRLVAKPGTSAAIDPAMLS